MDGESLEDMYEATRGKGFGQEVRRRIMIGTYVLSAGYYDAYYLRAQKVRTLIKRDFETVYADGIDALLTPASAGELIDRLELLPPGESGAETITLFGRENPGAGSP